MIGKRYSKPKPISKERINTYKYTLFFNVEPYEYAIQMIAGSRRSKSRGSFFDFFFIIYDGFNGFCPKARVLFK